MPQPITLEMAAEVVAAFVSKVDEANFSLASGSAMIVHVTVR